MAKNYIQPGEVLDHVVASARTSGVPFLLGARLGVPITDGAVGETIAVKVKGVFNLPKVTANVVAQGAVLYWDDTAKKLTTTVGTNVIAGYAAAAATSTDTTVDIAINA